MPDQNKQPEDLTNRQRSTRYPRHTLAKAEEFGRLVFELGPRNCDVDTVAQAANYKSAANGSFAALRSSASNFGLIKAAGSGYLSVTDEWIAAFHSENTVQLGRVRREAMLQPQLYSQLFAEYSGKQLPNVTKLSRDLYLKNYGVLKDAASTAAQVFIESAIYAGLIDNRGFLRLPDDVIDEQSTSSLSQLKSDGEGFVDTAPLRNDPPRNAGFLTSPPPFEMEGLDRIEIRLMNGTRAYLFIPVPLPFGEKERLKKYIDLLLEEPDKSSRATLFQGEDSSQDES